MVTPPVSISALGWRRAICQMRLPFGSVRDAGFHDLPDFLAILVCSVGERLFQILADFHVELHRLAALALAGVIRRLLQLPTPRCGSADLAPR